VKCGYDPGGGDEVVKRREFVAVGQKGANCGIEDSSVLASASRALVLEVWFYSARDRQQGLGKIGGYTSLHS
jgi:hypothetical protein